MKKLIPFLALVVGVSSALAQGIVNFNNNNLGEPPDRTVYMSDMATSVVGTNFVAQLYWSTDGGNSFTEVTAAARPFRPAGVAPAGTWIGGNRTLPTGVGGVNTTIHLLVRAWDTGGNPALRYDQARAQGLLWGDSAVFAYTQTLSTPAAAADIWMHNFRSFSLVPEPSVIGLGLIGIGALFMLRRRKA